MSQTPQWPSVLPAHSLHTYWNLYVLCLQVVGLFDHRGRLYFSGLSSYLQPLPSERTGPELQSSRRRRSKAVVGWTRGSTLESRHSQVWTGLIQTEKNGNISSSSQCLFITVEQHKTENSCVFTDFIGMSIFNYRGSWGPLPQSLLMMIIKIILILICHELVWVMGCCNSAKVRNSTELWYMWTCKYRVTNSVW